MGVANVSGRFIGAGKIHPIIRGERIFLNGLLVIGECIGGVWVREIQLMVTAQGVPGFGIAGFERSAAFDNLQPVRMDAMIGHPKPGGLVRQEERHCQSENQDGRAVWGCLQ